MIDIEDLMSFSDIALALGSAPFEMQYVLRLASDLNDTNKSKEFSLKVLAREKVYKDMIKSLTCDARKITDLTQDDYRSIDVMNSVIASFVIRDMTIDKNIAELKSFFVKLNASFGDKIDRIRSDIKVFMNSEGQSFKQSLMIHVMRNKMCVADIIPAFMQIPDAIAFVPAIERESLIGELNDLINQISMQDAIDVFYDCVKRDALSSFAKFKDADLTLSEFVAGIQELARYTEIDVNSYVEKAAEDLIAFEEVIT